MEGLRKSARLEERKSEMPQPKEQQIAGEQIHWQGTLCLHVQQKDSSEPTQAPAEVFPQKQPLEHGEIPDGLDKSSRSADSDKATVQRQIQSEKRLQSFKDHIRQSLVSISQEARLYLANFRQQPSTQQKPFVPGKRAEGTVTLTIKGIAIADVEQVKTEVEAVSGLSMCLGGVWKPNVIAIGWDRAAVYHSAVGYYDVFAQKDFVQGTAPYLNFASHAHRRLQQTAMPSGSPVFDVMEACAMYIVHFAGVIPRSQEEGGSWCRLRIMPGEPGILGPFSWKLLFFLNALIEAEVTFVGAGGDEQPWLGFSWAEIEGKMDCLTNRVTGEPVGQITWHDNRLMEFDGYANFGVSGDRVDFTGYKVLSKR